MSNQYGEAVRALRRAKSLGLNEAARQLGISSAYLSCVERGLTQPCTLAMTRKIARLLDGDVLALTRMAAHQRGVVKVDVSVLPESGVEFLARLAAGQRFTIEFWQTVLANAQASRVDRPRRK